MNCAIVGINWGDEGKGRMVDLIAADYDVVVRYQGGNNAGHTVVNEYGKFALHLLPSGIFRKDVVNVLGNGAVIDPEKLLEEMDELRSKGISITPENLKVSDRAPIVFPYHRDQDALEEAQIEVEKIEHPSSYVLDRNTNNGYLSFKSDSSIVEGVAKVFPLFFFLVAALVCITTMTRMVDEQRTQIGTLKALWPEGADGCTVFIIPPFTALAGVSPLAGMNGVTQVAARSVARMLVVVCRSFWAWRQTSSLSLVKVTSHSSTPAPIRAAARLLSTVCSGNCIGAPR